MEMRVTGGFLRGRLIRVPPGSVRPTQDRVRQALFSMLGPRVEGASFLDLFAGSGAVGIEAWSRGARRVTWVEADRRVLQTLRENVRSLCGLTAEVIWPMDVEKFLCGGFAGEPYDIIFADPPYGQRKKLPEGKVTHETRDTGVKSRNGRRFGEDWGSKLLRLLEARAVLAGNGWFILEQGREEAPVVSGNWTAAAERGYGDTFLRYYELRKRRTQ